MKDEEHEDFNAPLQADREFGSLGSSMGGRLEAAKRTRTDAPTDEALLRADHAGETAPGPGRMSSPSREEYDAKLDALEARTDVKFARLEGKLDLLVSKVDDGRREAGSNKNIILGTVVTFSLALAALLVAVVTYGDAIFSRGMQVRDVVNAVVKEQQATSRPPLSSTP